VRHEWTQQNKDLLKKFYPTMGVKKCAAMLGLPHGTVKSYVEYLRLKHIKLTDALLPPKLKCSKCKQNKSIKEFPKNGFQRRRDCNKCRKIYKNKYNKLNNKQVNATKRAWRKKNRKIICAKKRLIYASNPQVNLKAKLCARIRGAITKGWKSESTLKLLGCSLDFLKGHLQSQFTRGMNWNKVLSGKIHIDHIKPCSSFDLTKPNEQKICFHFSNLRPLWAADNLSKGDSYKL
jgi:hypothetical protein